MKTKLDTETLVQKLKRLSVEANHISTIQIQEKYKDMISYIDGKLEDAALMGKSSVSVSLPIRIPGKDAYNLSLFYDKQGLVTNLPVGIPNSTNWADYIGFSW